MKTKKTTMMTVVLAALLSSCATHYRMDSIERTRVLIDKSYDNTTVKAAEEFIAPFKAEVDRQMSPVVGKVANYLYAKKPESPLSNVLTDMLMWASEKYGEKPDFSVYNIGGMRAALAVGDVTIGDVIDVAPFENNICFVTLTGAKVRELFEQIAKQGGQGVSREVRLVITADGKLKSATVAGKEIDDNAQYRIVTLDYVAQGNDHMEAFRSGTDIKLSTAQENNVRFLIMDFFRAKMAQGESVEGKLDGRITIEH